ncbi:isochorismatase [Pseudoalteromonas porphyrae]|uniref:isochorismatase family protein n=1 Tax=Pseudoalteromonas TaxID=53246 RepID=UPI0006BA9B3E|nr:MULTISPECIES: isochorismatase family protein [Pseudoalteromonas]KPH94692.1 isochorismatase [Pseudoalteromonas porphyrae]
MRHFYNVQASQSVLLVVDIQEKLRPAMLHYQTVVDVTSQLIQAAQLHSIPIVFTQQYKQGLGDTEQQLKTLAPNGNYFDKSHFSACLEPNFIPLMKKYNRPQIIVVGMEAHVCVLQTCLDLIAHGFDIFILLDGVSSRNDLHRDLAVEQLRQAGAVISCAESVIFQWTEVAATPLFKKILKIVK